MKIHIIYLAAGSSRRFGSNKLLWEYEGRPLYRHGLDRLIEMASDRDDCTLTVVSRYDEILGYASAYPGVRTVYSPLSHLGASFSIRVALQALHDTGFDDSDYFMFMVADQPHMQNTRCDRGCCVLRMPHSVCIIRRPARESCIVLSCAR